MSSAEPQLPDSGGLTPQPERGLRGLIVGKFYPLHAGHQFLIKTALEQVEELVVVLGDHPSETIPWERRFSWLKMLFPTAQIERIEDCYGPDSEAWARVCLEKFGAFDRVFTSEAYGAGFAAALGCVHVEVDRPRGHFPVSGTVVRKNPYQYWNFLSAPVRAYFVRRVVLIGPESSGKTTLAQQLAAFFGTEWVPEYGRQYCEQLQRLEGHVWRSEEFLEIAAVQRQWEAEACARSGGLLICDTDAFATAVWHERYRGASHPDLLSFSDPPALYLLCGADAPFVQDGLRDGEAHRDWMEQRFVQLLEERGWPFVRLRGSWEERWRRARDSVLPLKPLAAETGL